MAGKTGKFRVRPDALLSLWRVMKKQASSMLTEREKKKKEMYFHNALLCSGDNFNLSCIEENIVVETLAQAHTADDRAGMEPRQLAALTRSQQPPQRLGAA